MELGPGEAKTQNEAKTVYHGQCDLWYAKYTSVSMGRVSRIAGFPH